MARKKTVFPQLVGLKGDECLPRGNIVHAGSMLPGSPSETSHDTAESKFRGIILRRARLVEVSRKAALEDKRCITSGMACLDGGPILLSEVVERQFYCVDSSNEVDLENFQIWPLWFRFRC